MVGDVGALVGNVGALVRIVMEGALVCGPAAKRFASEGGRGDGNDQHQYSHRDQQSQSRLSLVIVCLEVGVVFPPSP